MGPNPLDLTISKLAHGTVFGNMDNVTKNPNRTTKDTHETIE